MAEIGKFIFSNGKTVDTNNRKKDIQKQNSLLNRYDKDNNSVFDSSELANIQKDLEAGKLNREEEIVLYASITGLSIEKASTDFDIQNLNNTESIGTKEKTIRETVLQRFQTDTNNAFNIFKQSLEDAGIISKFYNNIKDLFNTEYCGNNVVKELYKQQVAQILLMQANDNDGITVEKYIQTKINLLNDLLKANGISDEERWQIAEAVKNMNLQQLNETITSFVEIKPDNANQLANKIYKKFLSSDNTKINKTSDGHIATFKHIPKADSIEAILNSQQTQEKLSFNQIYKLEKLVKFNPENIEKYNETENFANRFLSVNNFVAEINNIIDEPVKKLENLNRYSGTPVELDNAYNELNSAILKVLKEVFKGDEIELKEALLKYGGQQAKIKNGTLDFGAKGINFTAIVNMAHNIQNDLKSNLNKMLGNKTIEEIQEKLKQDYEIAYGQSATSIAQNFKQSQDNGVGYIKIGTTAIGLVTAVASGGVIIPIIGMSVATLGSTAISYTEKKTKAGGLTTEDKAELKEELKMAGIFTAAGFGIGSVSGQIGKVLLEKCPKLVAYCTQYGSDAVMTALIDYAIMGEINLTNESIGELMNILVGITTHHKINNHNNKKIEGPAQQKPVSHERILDIAGEKVIVKETDLGNGKKNIDLSNINLTEEIMASHPYDVKKGAMKKQFVYELNVDKFPTLKLPNNEIIDLNSPQYSKKILGLNEGEQLIIGREGDIPVGNKSSLVSRKHLVIYKQNGKLHITDTSANGTIVHTDGENIPIYKISKGQMNRNIPYSTKTNNLPVVKIAGTVIDLSKYRKKIESMQDGQILTIGRDGDIPINNSYASSTHLVIYKRDGNVHIKDISTNGTEIINKNPKMQNKKDITFKKTKQQEKLYTKINDAIDNLSTEKQYKKILKSIQKHFADIEDIFIELITKLESKAKEIGLKIEELLLPNRRFKEVKTSLSDLTPINSEIVKSIANKHHGQILNCNTQTQFFKKGNKFVVDLATNQNTQLYLGPIISIDLNEPRLAYLLKNLKEGEQITIGSFEGHATYRMGSNSNGVSRQHLIVTKEKGVLVFEDTSTYGTRAGLNKAKPISAKEVKNIFNYDMIKSSYYINKVHNTNKQLDATDYKNIATLINKSNGKYRGLWESTCVIDNGRNIDKLAAFAKLIREHGTLDYYLNLDDRTWSVIVNNICQKQNNSVDAIYNYKCSSNAINKALSDHKWSEPTRTYINNMTDYINTQTINKHIKVYRGEQYNGILSLVKLPNGINLGQAMEGLIRKNASQQEINHFINNYLVGNALKQERFMSTALNKDFCVEWAKGNAMGHSGTNNYGSIIWEIDVPGHTKGAFVEDFNTIYKEEYEIILQRESYLIIKGAYFDKKLNQWVIQARVEQTPYDKMQRY